MDSLILAVTALWDFLVFPVVLASILGVVVYAIVLPMPGWRERLATRVSLHRLQEQRLRSSLDTYGLARVVPIAAVFTVVFVLNAVRVVANTTGELLPGSVSYDPSALTLHVADPERLSVMWQRRPLLRDPAQLGTQMAELAAMIRTRDSTSLGAGSIHWRRQLGKSGERLDSVKFIMLVAILAFFARMRVREGRGRRTRHLLLVLLTGTLAGAFFIAEEVYAIEQVGFADFQAVWTAASEADTVQRQALPRHLDALQGYRERSAGSWWQLHWADWGYPRWLYRTFIDRQTLYTRRVHTDSADIPRPGRGGGPPL